MRVNELIQIIEAVSKSEVRQLIYKTNNEFLSINKGVMAEQIEQMMTDAGPAYLEADTALAVIEEHVPQTRSNPTMQVVGEQNDKLIDVPAPFVGTVMLNDSKTGDSFVELGDKVTKGQLLFVMESMKLFTDVTSPKNGKISQICVDNNQIVEYGTVILKIDEEA